MIHPSAIDLEAFSAGEESAVVSAHVTACEACGAFVAGAKKLFARFDAGPLLARARVEEAKAARRQKVTVLAAAGIPLAAAAIALLVLRPPKAPDVGDRRASGTATGSAGPVAMAKSSSDPDTTFKGSLQVAVVRERGKDQERFTADVRIRPGDRLRLEVALDRSQAILAGVLADDGSWVELMPEAVREPGTHLSEKSVRVDARPNSGTLLIGNPEDVRRARATGNREGVRAIELVWEAP